MVKTHGEFLNDHWCLILSDILKVCTSLLLIMKTGYLIRICPENVTFQQHGLFIPIHMGFKGAGLTQSFE